MSAEVCRTCGGRASTCAVLGHRPAGDNTTWLDIPEGLTPCGCLVNAARQIVGTCSIHAAPSATEPTLWEQRFRWLYWNVQLSAIEDALETSFTMPKNATEQEWFDAITSAIDRKLPSASTDGGSHD